jgi:hypothetical protein
LAPAEGSSGSRKGGKRRPSRRPSSIRAAAETAAGSAESRPKRQRKRASAPLSQKGRRRSRTSQATRQAAAEALQPATHPPIDAEPPTPPEEAGATSSIPIEGEQPGSGAAFPDYEIKSESWDPWATDGGPGGRTDPDFDAQRTLGEWLEGVIPVDAQVHFVNAGREFAQGVQVTVDHHTGKRRVGRDGDRPGGPSRIEIE